MMEPYAYDNFAMIVEAFERRANPAAYIRGLASYDGVAGRVTKTRGSGNFCSAPAVWEIRNARAVLLHQQQPEQAMEACRKVATAPRDLRGVMH